MATPTAHPEDPPLKIELTVQQGDNPPVRYVCFKADDILPPAKEKQPTAAMPHTNPTTIQTITEEDEEDEEYQEGEFDEDEEEQEPDEDEDVESDQMEEDDEGEADQEEDTGSEVIQKKRKGDVGTSSYRIVVPEHQKRKIPTQVWITVSINSIMLLSLFCLTHFWSLLLAAGLSDPISRTRA